MEKRIGRIKALSCIIAIAAGTQCASQAPLPDASHPGYIPSKATLAVDEVPFTAASIRAHHQALVDIASQAGGLDAGIRMNGAGQAAADYIKAAYEMAGLQNVRFEEFFPNRWWPDKYSLEVVDGTGRSGRALITFPLWQCEKAANVVLDTVYAGFGSSCELAGLDVKGKAVLVDMKRILHFIPSYWYTGTLKKVREAGAAAVIFAETRVDSPTGNAVGSAGAIKDQKGQAPELFPLPVLSIGKSDGAFVKAQLAQGPVKVLINLEYSLVPGRAVNVVGELPGDGSTGEYIIIGGHYDSWFNGAIDNLGSQASLIEMARFCAGIPQEKRSRTIIFASLFGHEVGNEAMGHAAFVERHADTLDKIACFLNVDGSGSWGWEEKDDTGEIVATGLDDKSGIFATSWALSALAREAVFPQAKGPWGEYPLNSFVADLAGPLAQAGFPTLLLISKHIYYHSPLDTLDRIDSDQVYRRTLMNVAIVKGLLDSPKGYYIGVDTNPSRKLKEGEKRLADLSPQSMPKNPLPWMDGAPEDLSFQVIPARVRVFSPVIMWPGFWRSDDILLPDSIEWGFGNLFGGAKKIATGTMYLLPGKKKITMTVTDGKGRTTSVSREITVTW